MTLLRRAALPTALGLTATGGFHLLGVPGAFAWGWGILVAAVILMLGIRLPEDPRLDAPGRSPGHRYIGSEVSRLAWAINAESGTVNEAVTRRVRATLRRRLARLGVDVDDPAHAADADRLLGAGLWQRLAGRRTTIADIRNGLDAAERLESLCLGGSSRAAPSVPAVRREKHQKETTP